MDDPGLDQFIGLEGAPAQGSLLRDPLDGIEDTGETLAVISHRAQPRGGPFRGRDRGGRAR